MSTKSQHRRVDNPLGQEVYGTLLERMLDKARGYKGSGVGVYRAVADEFIRDEVGNDRTRLTFLLHQSHNGPHRTYTQHSFDTDGDGMGAMKALAASALVSDMLHSE